MSKKERKTNNQTSEEQKIKRTNDPTHWLKKSLLWLLALAITVPVTAIVTHKIDAHMDLENEISKLLPAMDEANTLYEQGMYQEALKNYHTLDQEIAPRTESYIFANVNFMEGKTYYQLSLINDKENNLQKALASYKIVLTIFTKNKYPYDCAVVQNSVGNAYISLANIKDQGSNVSLAITALNESLSYLKVEKYPLEFAAVQNDLGNAYQVYSQVDNPVQNLQKAIQSFKNALQIYQTNDQLRQQALVENNLAVGYMLV